jgi:hypothetical protein
MMSLTPADGKSVDALAIALLEAKAVDITAADVLTDAKTTDDKAVDALAIALLTVEAVVDKDVDALGRCRQCQRKGCWRPCRCHA